MTWLPRWLRRIRERQELSAEVGGHLEETEDALVASGLPREEARLAARKSFGNVTSVVEDARDVWRFPLLDSVVDDIRYAFRLIRRHPAFAANVVLVSGLGIATCATTFGVVSGVLLSPLGFPAPERVFTIELHSSDGLGVGAISEPMYRRIASGAPGIDAITTGAPSGVRVDWNGEPEELTAWRVTPSYFTVYRVQPVIGRAFTEEEGARLAPVAILGNRLWRERFHGDREVVGKSVTLGGAAYTIVGVMPAGFHAYYADEPSFWLPSQVEPGGLGGPYGVTAQVRLKDGVAPQQASAVLAAVAPTRMFSRTTGDSVAASPVLIPVAEELVGDVEVPLRILFAAVMLVLVLVSANVTTLLLARTATRQDELDVRRALGATRGRQTRLLVTESMILTGLGGAGGVVVSVWATSAVRRLGVEVLPRMDAVTFGWRVLAFAALCTLAIAAISGIAPTLVAPRGPAAPGTGSRVTRAGVSSTLAVTQIALSALLVTGAGLLTKEFVRVLPTNPGFQTAHRATLYVDLSQDPDIPAADEGRARRFLDDVVTSLRAVHGVEDVAAMSYAPFSGMGDRAGIQVPGQPVPARPLTAWLNLVTTNWLDVMGIPLTEGRPFTNADGPGAPPVAIVNQTAAAQWWPAGGPIVGRQVAVSYDGHHQTATVVGVSKATRFWGYDSRSRPEVYLPVGQTNPRVITFVAATAGEPGTLSGQLRQALWVVAPRLPIAGTGDLEAIAMHSVRQPRFFAWALGVFGAAAVGLSALAVYGLLSFTVARRRREIGIRLAIGASPGRIARSVLAQASMLGGVGAAAGIVAALALTRVMADLLVEVKPRDASVFIGAAALVFALATIAATGPAWRALQIDPATTLRTE